MHFAVSWAKFVQGVVGLADVDVSAQFYALAQDRGGDVVGVRVPRIFDSLENQIEFRAVESAVAVSVQNVEKFKDF